MNPHGPVKTVNPRPISRRHFLAATGAAAAFTIVPSSVLGQAVGQTPPSDKLNIAGIGFGGRGEGDLHEVSSQNIVALCDVDEAYAGRVFQSYPKARKWKDFRKMLDEQKDIDAVVIATPDHLHATITMMALKLGKHVYCEKPLTHTVKEARMIAKAATEAKVATQLGNQGQADEETKIFIEMVRDGAIGNVREIHGWSSRNPAICARGIPRPQDKPPVPATLDWDLWLGPAPERPYHPAYLPFVWRAWWDFGTGVLGDIACHNFSAIFKALKLGHPKTIQASSTNGQCGDEIANETAPVGSVVHYTFEATADHPALTLTWYDGGLLPFRPEDLEPGRRIPFGDGMLYIGDKGKILDHRLIPESRMKEYGKPPRTLERSPGHHKEWLNACKGGPKPGSPFEFGGLLTEVAMLGNIAIRTNEMLVWDPVNMKFPNCPAAEKFLQTEYRKGWTL
jgi:predicted dehydrogenase